MKGKWKVVIHTVGLKFLAAAKVYVNDQYTGVLFKDWMAHAPWRTLEEQEWSSLTRLSLLPGVRRQVGECDDQGRRGQLGARAPWL